jgi:CheY-like chemotaxis protein
MITKGTLRVNCSFWCEQMRNTDELVEGVVFVVKSLYDTAITSSRASHVGIKRGWCMPRRVIVVDDDREVREIVTFVLGLNGFEVITAANGQQLQQELDTVLPDLIILDVMMPGEDGYQICRHLRGQRRTQHIPIIIITAHAEDIYERISQDLGAAHHITKPFHPLELAERVKALLVEEQEER